jgi:hypothetical protein
MSDDIPVGATCRPNFSAAGRRRRKRAAQIAGLIALIALGALIYFDAPWPWRLLVGLPAAGCFVSGLQVTRNTCVAHAATGSFENEDLSLTKADEEFAAASRRVAATIWRDALLGGVLVAALSAATAFVG